MLTRPPELVELPHELLKEFFLKAIQDKPATLLALRCVSRLFKEIVNNIFLSELGLLFGAHQATNFQCSFFSDRTGTLFKMLEQEPSRLKKIKTLIGIKLKEIAVVKLDDVFLPKPLDYFIISLVSARAYEDLYALYEEIRLTYSTSISLRRVLEAIFLQAAMNYNPMEFERLYGFIPFESDQVGYVCCENGVVEYVYKPLSDHALRFGNVGLAQALLHERKSPQIAPPA